MEKISQILQESNLSIQSTNTLKIIDGGISIYKDQLTKESVKVNCLKVLVAFPSLENHFTDLLTESLFRNKFTDQRFKDSVNYVIDNCKYPKPSIADFVSYDKKVKVYRYDEMVSNSFDFARFKKVKLSDEQSKPLWIRIEDFENNNFQEY